MAITISGNGIETAAIADSAVTSSKLAESYEPAFTRSSTQPSSPTSGDIWYDTSNGIFYAYNGAGWVTLSNSAVGSGGTVGTYSYGGTNYKYHVFTSTGAFEVTGAALSADMLLLGGGGPGGADYGGGGGAGGLVWRTLGNVPVGTYTCTIGAGGTGVTEAGGVIGTIGGDTTITGTFSLTAKGGGQGGGENSRSGKNGGCGGGASYTDSGGTATQTSQSGDSGSYGFGFNGGAGVGGSPYTSGGGGGCGESGVDANSSASGRGGHGNSTFVSSSSAATTAFLSAISKGEDVSSTRYLGGGGGGGYASDLDKPRGEGGYGFGGDGGPGRSSSGADAPANSGAGGGGAGGYDNTVPRGGNGGSGLIVIRYQI